MVDDSPAIQVNNVGVVGDLFWILLELIETL